MYLVNLTIKNFRAISSIEVDLKRTCNVIVGPNATGKTTLLEAIRLAKALGAPRTQNETNQVLTALGVSTPGIPNRFFIKAIAADETQPVQIKCIYKLEPSDLAILKEDESVAAMAMQIMLSNMGRPFASPSDLIGILSAPGGQRNQQNVAEHLRRMLSEIESGKRECLLEIAIDGKSGQIKSTDPMCGILIAYLDRRLIPSRTVFSYFPADRAIPTQEQPVQIGIADSTNQMESHNSQPQLKYTRLKNTIFGSVIAGKSVEQANQFKEIFSRILRGKSLKGVGVNDQGALKIMIEDDETKSEFSIDAMSSGEKGLILTFLLIAQTVERGGVVLLDEPELHLNPAVCRDVLSFLIDEYALPENLQLIICSHSPEILGVAFEREDCGLFHFISGSLLTPVRRQDLEEVEGALRRLGASPSESLLYKGTVFVEGDHDADLLQEGFKQLFQRYKIRDLGGRQNIEREIIALQEQENTVTQMSRTFFILDRDDIVTELKSSEHVKVLQWGRRCLENYLVDINTLTDLVKSDQIAASPITNVVELKKTLKNLAYTQIPEIAARAVYTGSKFANTSLTNREMQGKGFSEFADLIFNKISAVREQFALFDESSWKSSFITACEVKKTELEEKWETAWESECDGKKLFREFHGRVGVKEGILRFKLRVIANMAINGSENWLAMQSLLGTLMKSTDK